MPTTSGRRGFRPSRRSGFAGRPRARQPPPGSRARPSSGDSSPPRRLEQARPGLSRLVDVPVRRRPPAVDDLVEAPRERVEVSELEDRSGLAARQRPPERQRTRAAEPDQTGAKAEPQGQLELPLALRAVRLALESTGVAGPLRAAALGALDEPSLAPPGDPDADPG